MKKLKILLAMMACVAAVTFLSACKDAGDNWKHNDHTPVEGTGALVIRNSGPSQIYAAVSGLVTEDGSTARWLLWGAPIDVQSDVAVDGYPGQYRLHIASLPIDLEGPGSLWEITGVPYTQDVCIIKGTVTEYTVYAGWTEVENRDGSAFVGECPPEEDEWELVVGVAGRWQLNMPTLGIMPELALNHADVFAEVRNGVRTTGCRLTGYMDNESGIGPTGTVYGSLTGYSVFFRGSKADGTEYQFTGFVNEAGTSMSGTFTPANPDEDQWSAAKL